MLTTPILFIIQFAGFIETISMSLRGLPIPFSTIDQMHGSTLAQLASICDRSFIVAARQILANITLHTCEKIVFGLITRANLQASEHKHCDYLDFAPPVTMQTPNHWYGQEYSREVRYNIHCGRRRGCNKSIQACSGCCRVPSLVHRCALEDRHDNLCDTVNGNHTGHDPTSNHESSAGLKNPPVE